MLRELTVADLHIVHCDRGRINVMAAEPVIADSVQGKIRTGAEAFLAPKIVVCEGATEVGFLRGIDDHWIETENKDSFSYRGVALFDAKGARNIKEIAETLQVLGYDVAIVADSDEPDHFSDEDAEALRNAGITVVKWSDALSIEERVFKDLPWPGIISSFDAARSIWNDDARLLDQVETQFGQGFDRDFERWSDTPPLRTALGAAAKASKWFKRQSRGQEWAAAISAHLVDDHFRHSDLFLQLTGLRAWIDNV